MKHRTQVSLLLLLGLLVALLGAPAISAQGGDEEPTAVADDEWPQDCPVSNVPAAFADLPNYDPVPFAFSYWDGTSFTGLDPTEKTHYQDLRRFNGADGTPYLLLTRNGNPFDGGDDFPAELLVVQMGSRTKDGSIFTSNCTSLTGAECVLGNLLDHTLYQRYFVNNYVSGAAVGWRHAGGGQIVDGVYVVPLEKTCKAENGITPCDGGEVERGALAFVELQGLPGPPTFIRQIQTYADGTTLLPMIGVVGVTKLLSGKYLFVITGGSFDHGRELIFLQSTTDDLRDPDLKLEWKFKWYCNNLTGGCAQWCDDCYWDDVVGHGGLGCIQETLEFQTLNFVSGTNGTLAPEDDTLWLIGTSNTCWSLDIGEDRARLYRVYLEDDLSNVYLEYIDEAHLDLSEPWDLGDLDAAAGVYVSPKGRMALYTGPHDNTGWEVTGCTNPSGTERCKAYQMGQFAAQDHDNVRPVTTHTLAGSPGANGWYVSDVTVTLNASDPCGSGVAWTRYSIDGDIEQTYGGPFTVRGDGEHTIAYYSTDREGNQEAQKTAPVKLDTIPPTTMHELIGEEGENGWYINDVHVALDASDGSSGIATTEFSVDHATWTQYSFPLHFWPDGEYDVWYRSTDIAGNQESEKRVSFGIDRTKPTGSIVINGGASTTHSALVRVSASATDALSGPWQVRLGDNPEGPWSAWKALGLDPYYWLLPNPQTGSEYEVHAQFRDRAGNESEVIRDEITLTLYPGRPFSASYRLGASTYGAGGFEAGSAGYLLQGTLGQPSMIGQPEGAASGLASGYWAVQGHGIVSYPVYLPLVLRDD